MCLFTSSFRRYSLTVSIFVIEPICLYSILLYINNDRIVYLVLSGAVRMDFFLLKKVMWNVMFMAIVMVLASALLLIPFMLYALGMIGSGWNAIYVALFGTMIGSTDAASVIAILKAGDVWWILIFCNLLLATRWVLICTLFNWCLDTGGAPEILSIVLEGESLFNDASSLTMFEVRSGLCPQYVKHICMYLPCIPCM